jgi:hypothetical protein
MPTQLAGARVTGHDSSLNVEIDSTKGIADQVILRTVVTLSGGRYPGEYAETVVSHVHGGVLTIASWQFSAP